MQPIIEELRSLIVMHNWQDAFRRATECAQASQIPGLERYRNLDSLLETLNDLVIWTPRIGDPRRAFDTPIQFFFILNQEPLKSLQSPVRPADGSESLTPLSAWLVKFAQVYGSYLDMAESAAGIDTFKRLVDWDEFMLPPSGYQTFNQFFARHIKPGRRPIADISDDTVIVSPADSTFVGQWQINDNSEIAVDEPRLDLKGLKWSIHQLLEGSDYADHFRGGIFTHSYLSIADYHRWHSPVQGKLLEARVIQGQVYMDVYAKSESVDGREDVLADIVDSTGFQFVQTRGLIVIDSPTGLVACLPVGMALVSSVVITAEVGRTLHKGEELGYFAFGGSDFVMVFEHASNVHLICQPNVHYNQGALIGHVDPRHYPHRQS